jgi:hypothetical protein
MLVRLNFEKRRRSLVFSGIARALRLLLQVPVEILKLVSEWMESRIFQALRLVFTAGLIWLVIKGTHVHIDGIGLTTELELRRLGKAAVVVAGLGAILSILWSGSLCDGLAGVFLNLLDTEDRRAMPEDPTRQLNRFIRTGQNLRARWQCWRMMRRREGSRQALKLTLAYLAERRNGKPLPQPERISGGK